MRCDLRKPNMPSKNSNTGHTSRCVSRRIQTCEPSGNECFLKKFPGSVCLLSRRKRKRRRKPAVVQRPALSRSRQILKNYDPYLNFLKADLDSVYHNVYNIWIPWMCKILCLKIFQVHCVHSIFYL